MIDPNAITTIRVGQLPEAALNLSDNIPHEVGTDLKRATIQELVNFVSTAIGAGSGVGFLPISVTDGQQLPDVPTDPSFFLAGIGTFLNINGYPNIVCTEELNAIMSLSDHWEIAVEIPISADFPTGDSNYVTKFSGGSLTESQIIDNGARVLVGTTTDNGVDTFQIDGSLIATAIKKLGGTSAQYLMADGSTSTGGGGATPNLQEVTTAGATTTVPIIINSTDIPGLTVYATSVADDTIAIVGNGYIGVHGSGLNIGVLGLSIDGTAVQANTNTGIGVYATTSEGTAVYAATSDGTAIYATSNSLTEAVIIENADGVGINVTSGMNTAIVANTNNENGIAIIGTQLNNTEPDGVGVKGVSQEGTGVYGDSENGVGVYGSTIQGVGVTAISINGNGINAISSEGNGIMAYSENNSVIVANLPLASTSNIVEFKKNSINQAYISHDGNVTANSFVKTSGVNTQFLKADGSVDNNVYLTSADLPSTLDLFATTTPDTLISGYSVLIRNILDARYDDVAVNVPTGAITTTNQLLSSLITDTNVISGNPGVFNFTTIGNIRRVSGSGEATFYFRIYKRDSSGVETLITQSDNTLPVVDGGTYVEFSAVALWNDGVFLSTDRIVLKYYANRISGGSDPTYEFQFGGITPVRSTAAVPVAVLPNIFLSNLVDVEDVAPLPNEILYWNDSANLWEHSLVNDLLVMPTLQEVTDSGATTTVPITITTPSDNGLIGLTVTTNDNTSGSGVPSIKGIGVGDTIGIIGVSDEATGILGTSTNGNGVLGVSISSNGLVGFSDSGIGSYVQSVSGVGAAVSIGVSNTSNIAEFQKNFVNQVSISHDGKISANELKSNTLKALDSDILTLTAGGTNVTLDDTNSTLTVVGDLVADNIVRAGDTNANILLAGGGVAAVSDFLTTVPTLQEVTTVGAETTDKVSILHNSDFNALTVNNSGAAGVAISANGNIGVVAIGDTSGVYGTGYTGVYANGTNRAIYAETSNASAIAGVFNSHSSSTVDIVKFQKNNINQASISHDGKVTANAIIKSGGTSTQFLMADGSTSTGGGATPTLQEVTEAGDTTTVPTIFATTDPLSEDINSITATTDNGIGVFASSGTGTAVDAYSTSGIAIKASNFSGIAILGNSSDNTGVDGTSTDGIGVDGQSVNGIGVNSYSQNGVAISADTGLSTTSNIAEFKNNGVIQTSISNDGNVTSNSFIKDGGTSDEFLKADGSVDSNVYLKPIVNEFPATTVTGTLSETLLSTFTIPGGTLPADCMPDIRAKFSKSGDLGNAVMRLRINTVNNFATATQIATYAAVLATDTFLVSRNPVISRGNMNTFIATSSAQSDISNVATTESNFSINVANDIYLFVSIVQGSILDTTTLRAFKIIN